MKPQGGGPGAIIGTGPGAIIGGGHAPIIGPTAGAAMRARGRFQQLAVLTSRMRIREDTPSTTAKFLNLFMGNL